MIDKRKSPRQRGFLRGFVRLGDQNYSMGCIVRDMSETGAKLRFKCAISFAGNIELHIPEKEKIIRANVVWTDNCEVGVAFDTPLMIGGPADAASTDADLSSRVALLEAEITALKQMLRLMERHRESKANVA